MTTAKRLEFVPPRYDRLPAERWREPMRRWVEEGIEPGGFLLAILRNDLLESCLRADGEARGQIVALGAWCYDELPCLTWGSRERVRAWSRRFA